MKTLLTIAIIFVCLQVNGQMTRNVEVFIDTNNIWVNEVEVDDIPLQYNQKEYIELKITRLLFDYTWACWADSTKYEAAVYRQMDGLEISNKIIIANRPEPGEMIIGYLRDTVIYTHREPDLIGFTDYMKKKYSIE